MNVIIKINDIITVESVEQDFVKLAQIERSSGNRLIIKFSNSVLLYKIIVVQEQAAVIAELNTKLKNVDKNLEDANKREILLLLTLILVL